jgi:hypothetical protein
MNPKQKARIIATRAKEKSNRFFFAGENVSTCPVPPESYGTNAPCTG